MTLVTKVAGVLLFGGGIVGAGTAYALNSKSNLPSIKEQLIKDKKKLLVGNSKELWDIKLSTYQTIIKKDNKFKIPSETDVSLRTWCTENIEKEVNESNQKLYARVKEICTVPSHKEKFQKDSKDLVTSDGWATKVKNYQESGQDSIPNIKKDKDTAKNVEAWCKDEIEKEYEDGSKNNYPLILKWCTKLGK